MSCLRGAQASVRAAGGDVSQCHGASQHDCRTRESDPGCQQRVRATTQPWSNAWRVSTISRCYEIQICLAAHLRFSSGSRVIQRSHSQEAAAPSRPLGPRTAHITCGAAVEMSYLLSKL